MFSKIITFVALLAVVAAAPKPEPKPQLFIDAAPVAYTGVDYVAPVAYSSYIAPGVAYTAPVAAAYSAPYAYGAYVI